MATLAQIRIVLIETSHPGNIGAAARAMKVMGLSRLYLVAPQQFPSAEATARASGADDLLAGAVVCPDLESALAGCTRVYGASARSRTIPWPLFSPRECAAQVAEVPGDETVAFVFGRESSGLTNAELERCSALLHIPTNPDYSSLNLAAAVQVVSYELRQALLEPGPEEASEGEPLADHTDVERFYDHLEQTLVELEFLDPENPRQLMRRLRRLFNRTALQVVEVNILRGILTAAQKKARGIHYGRGGD